MLRKPTSPVKVLNKATRALLIKDCRH
ncbi:unnamed protein product [Linum tenue]|uniref:Uncharacterized protein n=1 Tax=Linum tenue TaxID=586396 RepID=A0AAV0HXN0_9ROSI|nr:unnamed protein product [Linum tenue]